MQDNIHPYLQYFRRIRRNGRFYRDRTADDWSRINGSYRVRISEIFSEENSKRKRDEKIEYSVSIGNYWPLFADSYRIRAAFISVAFGICRVQIKRGEAPLGCITDSPGQKVELVSKRENSIYRSEDTDSAKIAISPAGSIARYRPLEPRRCFAGAGASA